MHQTVSFLPTTLGGYAAVAAALAATTSALLGFRNRRKIQEVHVLVNSNLDSIKGALATRTDERDQLQHEKDTAQEEEGGY